LANIFILVSCLAFAAIAIDTPTFWDRLRRIFHLSSEPLAVMAPPRVSQEEGWTLIRCDDPEAFNEWLGRDEEGMPFRPGEEPSLGSHLLVELYGCDPESLKREDCVGAALRSAAVESKATVVDQSFHEFRPYGVSGAVIIQESHYTIHTWPEHGYAAVDLFYCGGTVLVHRAVEVLQDSFKPSRIKFLVVRRGLQHEVAR
jgi:S-adenosylmethionine decarboxylase